MTHKCVGCGQEVTAEQIERLEYKKIDDFASGKPKYWHRNAEKNCFEDWLNKDRLQLSLQELTTHHSHLL